MGEGRGEHPGRGESGEHLAKRLGRRIRRRRRFLDLSQEALAERAGIHRTQISGFEHGGRTPHLATLVRLAAALGVSVDQLLAGGEEEAPGSRPGDPGGGCPAPGLDDAEGE